MKIIKDSHLDHALTEAQIEFIKTKYADQQAFLIDTFELEGLGLVPCGLHGPIMGDEPVKEEEVTHVARGGREHTSRLVDRAPRLQSKVTVIMGPHGDEPCVLYTAFGGPLAPKEPGDPSLKEEEQEESKRFWAEHALSA